MRLGKDVNALESLPLKLMIVAIVALMSVIPAGQALEGFRNRDFAMRAQLQLETMVSAAQTLMIEGLGGARSIHFDFSNEGSIRFGSLSIGDSRGGTNMSTVMLRLSVGTSIIRTTSEPPVWMMSKTGETLSVHTPVFDLRFSAQMDNRTTYVLAELV